MRRTNVLVPILILLSLLLGACAPELDWSSRRERSERRSARRTEAAASPGPGSPYARPKATDAYPATSGQDAGTAGGAYPGSGPGGSGYTAPQPTALAIRPAATTWVVPTPVLMPTELPTLVPPTPRPLPTDPPTPTPDPFQGAGAPVRLEMPSLAVDAIVERVGLTADRAMDVPKGWMNAGWFMHGFRPGETGNSVIAGHLDTNTGGPAVFWDLNRLRPGDEIRVTYENQDQYTFVVQESEVYDYDAQGPIIERIFGPSLTSDLNLITCDGAWDRGGATYTKRLVVFTTLAPEKTVRAERSGTYE